MPRLSRQPRPSKKPLGVKPATPVTRVAEPVTAYSAKSRAKLFANGRSQAVRLPKEFRLPGNEVLIHREGNRVIIEPLADEPLDKNGWPIGFWEQIDRMTAGIEIPEIEPMGVHFLEPEEIDPSVKWRKGRK